jgi:predicted ATP-grasp superfamily ATP-dependent carboligase
MMDRSKGDILETDRRLMIFGASTRAAAQSAVRAGLRPVCADHFADEDLREIADVLPLVDYPNGLVEVAARSPPLPWVYTGALENRPAVLEKLAALRPLWGNPAGVVRAVRNPFRLCGALTRAGLPALPVQPGHSPPPADGRWMVKPWRSSAGHGIHVWQGGAPAAGSRAERCYFQQRAAGQPISALFLSMADETALIGASEQLIGLEALSARPFGYCGSIGPIGLSETVRRQIEQTGAAIASEFGLRGLFGIDFMLERDLAWPTEVNPRYTASVEIYEWVLELPLLEWHCRACRAYESRPASRQIAEQFQALLDAARSRQAGRMAAKAVVYAPFSLSAPDLAGLERSAHFVVRGVRIADRPKAGARIVEKAPVCTLIAKQAKPAGVAAFESSLSAMAIEFERNRVEN